MLRNSSPDITIQLNEFHTFCDAFESANIDPDLQDTVSLLKSSLHYLAIENSDVNLIKTLVLYLKSNSSSIEAYLNSAENFFSNSYLTLDKVMSIKNTICRLFAIDTRSENAEGAIRALLQNLKAAQAATCSISSSSTAAAATFSHSSDVAYSYAMISNKKIKTQSMEHYSNLNKDMLATIFQYCGILDLPRYARINSHWYNNAKFNKNSTIAQSTLKIQFWSLAEELKFYEQHFTQFIEPKLPIDIQRYSAKLKKENDKIRWHQEFVTAYSSRSTSYQAARFDQMMQIINSAPITPGFRVTNCSCAACCRDERLLSGRHHRNIAPTDSMARSLPVNDLNALYAREKIIEAHLKEKQYSLCGLITQFTNLRVCGLEYACLRNGDISFIQKNNPFLRAFLIMRPTIHQNNSYEDEIDETALDAIADMKLEELRIPFALITRSFITEKADKFNAMIENITALQLDHFEALDQKQRSRVVLATCGEVLDILKKCAKLKVLSLADVAFCENDFTRLAAIESLETLHLYASRFTRGYTTGLGDMTKASLSKLTTLVLSGTKLISENDLRYLPESIKNLSIERCANLGDRAIFNIARTLIDLESLTIVQCPITNLALTHLTVLEKLHTLTLAEMTQVRSDEDEVARGVTLHAAPRLTDDALMHISRLMHLTRLVLTRIDSLSAKALAYHMQNTSLEELAIDDCSFMLLDTLKNMNLKNLTYDRKPQKPYNEYKHTPTVLKNSYPYRDQISVPAYTCYSCNYGIHHGQLMTKPDALTSHGEDHLTTEFAVMVSFKKFFETMKKNLYKKLLKREDFLTKDSVDAKLKAKKAEAGAINNNPLSTHTFLYNQKLTLYQLPIQLRIKNILSQHDKMNSFVSFVLVQLKQLLKSNPKKYSRFQKYVENDGQALLKAEGIQLIINNWNEYRPILKGNDVAQFVTDYIINGTWAEHVMLDALAQILKINFELHNHAAAASSAISIAKNGAATIYVNDDAFADKHENSASNSKKRKI